MVVSISRIKLFKSCRRAYELRYIHDLVPVEAADALATGTSYHELLEWLYKHGDFDGVEEDNSKELAMACAYWKYIYPKFKVKAAEEWIEYQLPYGHKLVGRVDGIAEDGCLVEHKTTSGEITEAYEYELMWDEQILAYMLATGARKMWYTVCRKPTIRQKKGETDEEFFRRMVEWYDEDTDAKIRLLVVERTDAEVRAFREDLKRIVVEMNRCKLFYRNCGNCNKWGRRCEYSSVCLHYDPNQEYIEFKKREEVKP